MKNVLEELQVVNSNKLDSAYDESVRLLKNIYRKEKRSCLD